MLLLVDRRTGPNCSTAGRWPTRAAITATVICVAACGSPQAPTPSPPPSDTSARINPARIDRVRGDLPTGYETADLRDRTSPAALWGYGTQWSADPPQCAALADPAGAAATTGWSGSGPGGIVYAVVAAAPGGADPSVLAECGHWTITGGRTTGSVTLGPAPHVDDATTIATATASTTVVEGGTETRSHAETLTAYLPDHVAFVAVVTDPGSPNPQLDAGFAAALLVKTVSALRG